VSENKNPKILIAGYYGFGNLGDELILSTILGQLRQKYSGASLAVLSADPRKTAETHRVRSVSRWKTGPVFLEMWKCDIFILGGGGLLQDKTSSRSLLYYLGLILLARLLSVSTILYALGVESLSRPFGRFLVKAALSSDQVTITVRDHESKELLRRIGIPEQRVHLTGDPVFCREVPRSPEARYERQRRTGLFIPRFPCPTSADATFRAIVRGLEEKHRVSVQTMFFQPREEERRFAFVNPASVVRWTAILEERRVDELLAKFRQFDFVVSARFHGLVLAALSHRPFLGIGDAHKVGRFCESWGMPFLPWEADAAALDDAVGRVLTSDPNPLKQDLNRWRAAASRTVDFVRPL
jgi:polysaccharide pyruvyl transferase CsaB